MIIFNIRINLKTFRYRGRVVQVSNHDSFFIEIYCIVLLRDRGRVVQVSNHDSFFIEIYCIVLLRDRSRVVVCLGKRLVGPEVSFY